MLALSRDSDAELRLAWSLRAQSNEKPVVAQLSCPNSLSCHDGLLDIQYVA